MTERKKTDSLKEAGKKTELDEKQLQEISGGPIYMDRLQTAQVQLTDKADPTIAASLNFTKQP